MSLISVINYCKTGKELKNVILWDVTLCGSRKNRRFGGIYRLHHRDDKNQRGKNSVNSNYQPTQAAKKYCSVLRLLVTANVVPSSPIHVTLIMEALLSSETLVLTRATTRGTAFFMVTAMKTSNVV
jgi:hypothetical protein